MRIIVCMRNISVEEFKEAIASHKEDATYDFINVCTPEEYAEKHIEGVRSVPLDTVPSVIRSFSGKEHIYVHCRGGGRSRMAIQLLEEAGVEAELINVDGGIMAWDQAGFDTKKL